jgi:hypothetical protein
MHDSDLRFEHCYRLDMDARVAAAHREHCWRDWNQTYAHDEPLDRIEYARRRIAALESGDKAELTIHNQAPTSGRVFEEVGSADPVAPMAAPAPTSAHEPPPKTAPIPAPRSSSEAIAATTRPGDACAGQCERSFGDCGRLCEAKQADCATCREDYRSCMRRCFQ